MVFDKCSCFKFGLEVFQQVIVIPMGSDTAPFTAIIFLFFSWGEMDTEARAERLDPS